VGAGGGGYHQRENTNHHGGRGGRNHDHGERGGAGGGRGGGGGSSSGARGKQPERPKDLDTLTVAVQWARAGTGEIAELLKDSAFKPGAPAYTTLIKVCGRNGAWEKAWELFESMQVRSITPLLSPSSSRSLSWHGSDVTKHLRIVLAHGP
jgi:pentatricopeptide repeat protein